MAEANDVTMMLVTNLYFTDDIKIEIRERKRTSLSKVLVIYFFKVLNAISDLPTSE